MTSTPATLPLPVAPFTRISGTGSVEQITARAFEALA